MPWDGRIRGCRIPSGGVWDGRIALCADDQTRISRRCAFCDPCGGPYEFEFVGSNPQQELFVDLPCELRCDNAPPGWLLPDQVIKPSFVELEASIPKPVPIDGDSSATIAAALIRSVGNNANVTNYYITPLATYDGVFPDVATGRSALRDFVWGTNQLRVAFSATNTNTRGATVRASIHSCPCGDGVVFEAVGRTLIEGARPVYWNGPGEPYTCPDMKLGYLFSPVWFSPTPFMNRSANRVPIWSRWMPPGSTVRVVVSVSGTVSTVAYTPPDQPPNDPQKFRHAYVTGTAVVDPNDSFDDTTFNGQPGNGFGADFRMCIAEYHSYTPPVDPCDFMPQARNPFVSTSDSRLIEIVNSGSYFSYATLDVSLLVDAGSVAIGVWRPATLTIDSVTEEF